MVRQQGRDTRETGETRISFLAASATNRLLAFLPYQEVKRNWRETDNLVGVGTKMVKIPKSWEEELQEIKQQMQAAENAEPWRLRLERLRGKVGDDGIERISTQAVFDVLEVPQRNRGAGACRRLAKAMSDLGWAKPTRAARTNPRLRQG